MMTMQLGHLAISLITINYKKSSLIQARLHNSSVAETRAADNDINLYNRHGQFTDIFQIYLGRLLVLKVLQENLRGL